MNAQEKIEHINNIINAYENLLCPYCFGRIEKYVEKGITKQACPNHNEGTITVSMKDYYNAIYNIVRFSQLRKIITYKTF